MISTQNLISQNVMWTMIIILIKIIKNLVVFIISTIIATQALGPLCLKKINTIANEILTGTSQSVVCYTNEIRMDWLESILMPAVCSILRARAVRSFSGAAAGAVGGLSTLAAAAAMCDAIYSRQWIRTIELN